MVIDWSFIFSLVTAIAAVLALALSLYQLRISNKQHLFDKRMEHYLFVVGLIELYKKNLSYFQEKKEEVLLANDLSFAYLTNNSYLEGITSAIVSPLTESYHKALLLKLEDIKGIATKSIFLYKRKAGQLLRDFIFSYQELLFRMYQYQILLNEIEKRAQEDKISLEEAQKSSPEEECRIDLQEAITHLNQSYDALVNGKIVEKIKKQIKL